MRFHSNPHLVEIVTVYLLSIEVLINELPLYPADRPVPSSIDFGKTECFYACLSALTRFHEIWLALTPEELPGMPMPLHMLAHRCTHILYRLALVDDPAWDRAAVARALDPLETIERSAALSAAVPAAIGLETDGTDIYSRIAAVQRETVPIWRRALEEAGVGGMGNTVGVGDLAEMDLAFDGWFSESLAPFNPF